MRGPLRPVYGDLVSSAVRSFLAEPRAPDPPARVWRDWVLLAVMAAVAPCSRRSSATDLVWRPAGLVVCVALVDRAPVAPHAPAARDRDRVRRPPRCSTRPRRCPSADEPMAILVTHRVPAGAPVRAAPVGVGTRRGDRDGVRPRRSPSSSEIVAGSRRRPDRRRAVPPASRRARRRGPLPGQRAAARARPGQAARARAAGARAARHGRPPRLGDRHPRPGRPHARRHAARRRRRRARGHRGGGLAHARRAARAWSGRCATARSPSSRPQRGVADIAAARRGAADGPRVDVELAGDLDDLRPLVGAAIYRIAQESITNAVRHARHATRIDVRVDRRPRTACRLTVRDDGDAGRRRRLAGLRPRRA